MVNYHDKGQRAAGAPQGGDIAVRRRGKLSTLMLSVLDQAFAVPSPQSETESAPLCPKCGIPMVLRMASQGDYKGKQFYGCRNYPRCREM